MKTATSDPAAEHFHHSAGVRATLATLLFFMLTLEVFVASTAVGMIASEPTIAVILGLTFAAISPLALLIFTETAAAFRLTINVARDAIALRLPARRGHVRHAVVSRTIPLAEIAAVETRAEAFTQIGTVAVQQAYRLVLGSGETIELGADRQFRAPVIGDAARCIATRTGLEIGDRGMIDGAPGFLATVGTSVPDWDAAPLSDTESTSRHSAAANALKIVNLSLLLVMIARLIFRR